MPLVIFFACTSWGKNFALHRETMSWAGMQSAVAAAGKVASIRLTVFGCT
jgi:hypothetical protein